MNTKHLWLRPDDRRDAVYLYKHKGPITERVRRDACIEAGMYGWGEGRDETRIAIVRGGKQKGGMPSRKADEVGEVWVVYGGYVIRYLRDNGDMFEEGVR